MKNYNEMANDVFHRITEYKTVQKRKRKILTRIITPLCVICLIALMGVGVWQNGLFDRASPPPIAPVVGNNGIGTKQTGNNQPDDPAASSPVNDSSITLNTGTPANPGTVPNPDTPPREWTLNVNKISGSIRGAKKYYDPALYYTEIWDSDKMAAYLGVDLSVIGDGLTYSGNSNFTVTLANDGTVAYDTAGYCYNESDLLILVSKIGTPYDCMYQLDSNEKTAFKLDNGSTVSVLIGGGSDGLLFADFEHNDLNYRVTAKNISENKFGEIIKDVLAFSVT